MNKACRIGLLIRNLPRFSFQRLTSFPFYSYSTANPKSSYEDEVEESESFVYRHALRHQRPTAIIGHAQLENSGSFIGRVDKPLELKKTKDDSVGVYTFINVSNPNTSNHTFRIQVDMWGEIAKIGLQYMKQNDLIYVSGRLCSYQKARDNGGLTSIYYAINVKELRYVDEDSIPQKLDKSQLKPFEKSKESQTITTNILEESQFGEGDTGVEICTDRSCLWQMFFCKPHEWWDKRKSKQYPSSPDFKHKFTGENLSLNANDPPWVKRQLQLLDIEIAKQKKAQGIDGTGMERNQLWHLFFNNPHEWWDNRESKKHSRAPDFKNKETGEALWINPDDPPWIKRQLEVLDSSAELRQGESTGSSCFSRWMLDDKEDGP